MFTLIPAYGRDYKSAREALADFVADKDFEDASWDATGRYVNRPQIPADAQVCIRFKRLASSVLFRCGDAESKLARLTRKPGSKPKRTYRYKAVFPSGMVRGDTVKAVSLQGALRQREVSRYRKMMRQLGGTFECDEVVS